MSVLRVVLGQSWLRTSVILSLLLSTSTHTSNASPAYDPSRPYQVENFDPAEADPTRAVACVGSAFDLELPMLGDFNPNTVSVQKLCSKPQYNGGEKGQHAGAFCGIKPRNGTTRTTGEVAFDIDPRAEALPALQNPRVLLGCFYRCFCTDGLVTTSVQPRSNWPHFGLKNLQPSAATYELQLEVNSDLTTPISQKRGKLGRTPVPSLIIAARSQIRQDLGFIGALQRQQLSLDPENEIQCKGNLPDFNLPSPYTSADFSSVQQMCAVALSGGNRAANAGGYCHLSFGKAGLTKTVWFADDMTPRLDWTWAGGNFFAAAAIRFHCWRNCACKDNPTKDDSTTPLWKFVYDHELREWDNGAVSIQQTGSNQNQGQQTQVLPPQHGAGSPSGTCGDDSTDFCPVSWDAAAFGPVPRAPPDVTEVIKPNPPNTNMTVCGNTCSGPLDCASATTPDGYSCSCALPSVDDAHTLGLDPVVPIAVCLALFSSFMKTSSLSGRDTRSYADSRGVPHTCRCNETMIADECCGVEGWDSVVVI